MKNKKDEKKYLAFMLSLIKRDAVQNSIIFLNEEDYKNIGDKVKDFISKQLKQKYWSLQIHLLISMVGVL